MASEIALGRGHKSWLCGWGCRIDIPGFGCHNSRPQAERCFNEVLWLQAPHRPLNISWVSSQRVAKNTNLPTDGSMSAEIDYPYPDRCHFRDSRATDFAPDGQHLATSQGFRFNIRPFMVAMLKRGLRTMWWSSEKKYLFRIPKGTLRRYLGAFKIEPT